MLYLQARTIPLMGAIIILLVTATIVWIRNSDHTSNLSSLHFSTSRTHSVIFRNRPGYHDLTKFGDEKWDSVLPPNGGFASLPTKDGGESKITGITMFHQLRCLQILRNTIQELAAVQNSDERTIKHASESSSAARAPKTAEGEHQDIFGVRKRGEPEIEDEDWTQCLDYLVQGVVCSADDTLEPANVGENGKLIIDGSGTSHQCRSTDRIWKMAASWRGAEVELEDSVADLTL
jgi:hypothetical protein